MSLEHCIKQLNKLDISLDSAVLAGGQGSRMSGRDKGLVTFKGRPMVQKTIELLAPLAEGHQVLINCNRNIDAYRRLSPRICQDISTGYQGPLAGIETVLNTSKADVVFVMPCDTPFADITAIERIANALVNHASLGRHLVPVALKDSKRKHPLHCCIPRTYLPSVKEALSSEQYKLMRWLEENNVIWVDVDSPKTLENISTIEQLSRVNASS